MTLSDINIGVAALVFAIAFTFYVLQYLVKRDIWPHIKHSFRWVHDPVDIPRPFEIYLDVEDCASPILIELVQSMAHLKSKK
mgnify:CR=1 FL=1